MRRDASLSHWGWGRADRFLDRDGRASLGAQLQAFLGFAPSEPREPTPLDEVRLPKPRLRPPESLSFASTDPEDRLRHTYGRSYPEIVRGFEGDFAPAPDVVLHPSSERELEASLDWADAAGAAVVPFGGGTSVVGGVTIEVGPGSRDRPPVAVIELSGLSALVDLDAKSRLARIGAGARGPVLERALAAHGLTLRCFPQSFEHSTLGGWVATRAGGHFATGPTHIDDLVAATRTLTPTGWLETRPLPASGAGPSPDRLILGSEGTLGVIADATVRVRPRPVHRASATVRFDSFAAAAEAARAVVQSGLTPANCRVLDEREAALNGAAQDGSALLLLGFESAHHPQSELLGFALRVAEELGGRCPEGPRVREERGARETTGDGAEAWRNAFVDAPYLQSNLVSLGVLADTFETATTWAAFPELHAQLVQSVRGVMKKRAGAGRLSCRFTHVYPDGPAPYYTFICPVPAGGERELWAEVKSTASDIIVGHGATITHHHAVGRAHRPWYEAQSSERFLGALAAAKRAVDPRGAMNPGVLIR